MKLEYVLLPHGFDEDEVEKHYGPGPHPGTNTPQKIHGQQQGIEPIGDVTEDFANRYMAVVDPYIFHFRTDSDVEYNSIITDVREAGGGSAELFVVQGQIQADDGEFIGEFERFVYPDRKYVYNSQFRVHENFRGEGIGLSWLVLTEKHLADAGYERVEVFAANVGRYAWAKHGYDFLDDVNGAKEWWAMQKKVPTNSRSYPKASIARWNQLVSDAERTSEGGRYPQPWEVASIPVLGKERLLEGVGWSGSRDLTKIYKADSGDYNRLLTQWVEDGKGKLIENDDPSWFAAVEEMINSVEKHGGGSHDDDDHGNWADGRVGAGQRPSKFKYPNGKSMMRTQIGAIHEDLFVHQSVIPEGDKYTALSGTRFHRAGKGKHTSRIDVLMGEYAIEVKSVHIDAKSKKATMKRDEVLNKYKAASKMKRRPATVVQEVDQANGIIHVYFFPDEFASRSIRTRTPDWSYRYTDADVFDAMERNGFSER